MQFLVFILCNLSRSQERFQFTVYSENSSTYICFCAILDSFYLHTGLCVCVCVCV